ncbi:Twinfilin-1 [Tieghemiomyces parasiticus]|uniref:Twinfilin-1 n=1 Tax=Tieghemiomyces parasiticus TaxID=78921 RepID=A0A9W8DUE9_9FUNG|nr:Twinfilin-1 [Tieghemiomyces parasiticus]
MSSLGSGVQASAKLKALLNDLKEGGQPSVLVVKVAIEGSQLELVETKDGTVDAGARYSPIEDLVTEDRPAYFLIRRADSASSPTGGSQTTANDENRTAGRWCFVTWVPESKVGVRERMLYASSQSALKFAFGFGNIIDTVHLTAMNDIKPRFRAATKEEFSPREVMSKFELNKLEAIQMENKARSERLSKFNRSCSDHTSPMKATPAAVSGGFHTVRLPLTSAAKSAVEDFFATTQKDNVLELKITDDKTSVDLAESNRYDDIGSKFPVTTKEPRFYVVRFPDGAFVGETIVVYLCPENSPPKWRMVYSTALSGFLEECKASGFAFDYKVDLFNSKECTFTSLADKIRTKSVQSLARAKSVQDIVNYANTSARDSDAADRVGRYISTRPSPSATSMASHPVYSLMADAMVQHNQRVSSGNGSSGPGSMTAKKKIVIPPPGAY